MFHTDFKRLPLHRRQKAYIWSKGLKHFVLINLSTGLFPDDEDPLPKNPGTSDEAEVAALLDQAEMETTDDYVPEQINNDDSEGEDEEFMRATRKRKKPAKTLRQKWSEEEVSELMELFAAEFETNTLPGQKQIETVMRKSLQNQGVIHKRKRDTIKKKLSNMMISRRG